MLTITAQLTFAEMGTIRGRIVSQASSYGSDMGAVIQILNNITYGQEISIECEDINCDGKVDMGDVILLLNNITYGYPVKCC